MSAGRSDLIFDAPFNAGKAHSRIDADVNIPSDGYYVFYLELFFGRDNLQERQLVQSVAGSGAITADGHRLNNGVPIPVRLSVDVVEGGGSSNILSEEIYQEELDRYGADSFSKKIKGTILNKGKYIVHLEAMENIDALKDIKVNFVIQSGKRK